ncbi:MAG: hypothetical protein LBI48_13150 [Burkholderiaceae bacterium]|jgi:hypothetical protein|nr:hypothetical protein [Burkholderiaceae bacterium]
MNFELPDWTQAKINNVNIRSEKCGSDDLEPAVDLSISIEQPNSVLAEFDGFLLSALYYKSAASVDTQAELDGVQPVSERPNLRFAKLAYPLKWEDEGSGYTLEIDHGLGGKSNVALTGCAVNAFAINPKEGGTVELKFRVQCAGSDELTEKTLGKLAMLVQHTVPIMLLAPDTEGSQQSGEDLGLTKVELAGVPHTPESALAQAVGAQP